MEVNNNVIIVKPWSDNFKIVKIDKVTLDGIEKSRLIISFNGYLYGWFDPIGIHQEVYKLTNGVFKGVIE